MKEQAIAKINKIGNVSNILTNVCKALIIMGMVACLVGAVLCFLIPDKLVSFSLTPQLSVHVDYSVLGDMMTPEDRAALNDPTIEEQLKQEFVTDEELSGMTVSVANQVIHLEDTEEGDTYTMHDVAWLVMMAFIMLTMSLVTLIFVGKLCKAFRDCDSPFAENVIRKMQNLAYALIPWTIVSIITDTIMASVTSNKFSMMFSVDLGVILTALLVLVLAYIFKYGAVLQQESDETL
ncbi:MAG: DUF2975 domain-containing protein [Lachnospiraceae bacterium]|nr:DUF2975 domain-containing protein [Lachnospiraceae bacterium]